MKETTLKRVYFVRHGETDANVNNVGQRPDQPLNKTGEQQAGFVAERSTHLTIDKIIASDLLRARQTAEKIAEVTGEKIEFSELFREFVRPSELYNIPHADPRYKEFLNLSREHTHDPDWHFADEENAYDLAVRTGKALEFLKEASGSSLLVVSHGTFLHMLFLRMVAEDPLLAAQIFHKSKSFLRSHNTGITWCDLIERDGKVQWAMRTWNDHAHLG